MMTRTFYNETVGERSVLVERCTISDGQETCCLQEDHEGPHMGRWYTMSPVAIERHRAEVEKYRALGKSQ